MITPEKNPVGPVKPGSPVGPVKPGSPVGPVKPGSPVYPVGPCSPVAPVAPDSPVYPVDPRPNDVLDVQILPPLSIAVWYCPEAETETAAQLPG